MLLNGKRNKLVDHERLKAAFFLIGHNQLKTTNAYLRVVGTDLAWAMEKLSYSLPATKLAEVVEFTGIKR